MCGLAGVFGPRDPVAARALISAACERMRHRGPDDEGLYAAPDGRAMLGFRRLSILDLSAAGHQPMGNEDGTVWLIFNGEIYNHVPLRADLERRGHHFRSRSDSEVLLHLWEERGPDLVHALNGMFAFAIWDERTGTGFVARDHVGIKPVYCAQADGAVWFASEAKALIDVPGVGTGVDRAALTAYLTFLWVPGSRTLWSDITKLEPGHRLTWQGGRATVDRWWDWDQTPGPDRTGAAWAEELRHELGAAVERQLQSDVPLGAFLSGGLDSSSVVGAMRDRRPEEPIQCYAMSAGATGGEGFVDDLPYARRVAAAQRLDLDEFEADADLISLWPRMIWHSDEPLADPAVGNTYIISRHARAKGTIVLLSGQGGDELFHGYRSHLAVQGADRLGWIPPGAAGALERLGGRLAGAAGVRSRPLMRRALKVLHALAVDGPGRAFALAEWSGAGDRAALLTPETADAGRDARLFATYRALYERSRGRTAVDRWSYVLLNTFLPALNLTYSDKAGMAASVEIRVPLLDRAVVELAGRIPARWKIRGAETKWILGEAAAPWLPDGIRRRPKTGFGAPVRAWLRGPLADEVRSVLLSERALARGWLQPDGVRVLLDDLAADRRDVAYLAWALYTLEHWARIFQDNGGRRPDAG